MATGVAVERLLDRLDEIEAQRITRDELLALYDELAVDEADEEPIDEAGDEAEPFDVSPPPAPPRRR